MSKRCIVLNSRNASDTMLDYLKHVKERHPFIGLADPTKTTAHHMVFTMVAAMAKSRSKRMEPEMDVGCYYASILFGVAFEQVLHSQAKFADRLIAEKTLDTLYFDLEKQVDGHIERATWTDWTVINSGTLILLAEGDDHRVTEWEKLTGYGEEEMVTLDISQVLDKMYQQFEAQFGPNYPTSQINALAVDALIDMFPQLKIDESTIEGVNYELAVAYGIVDLITFKQDYVTNMLLAYGVTGFNRWIDFNRVYECAFVSTGILTIRERKAKVPSKNRDADLAAELQRGDYLPREDRERAERWIMDNQ